MGGSCEIASPPPPVLNNSIHVNSSVNSSWSNIAQLDGNDISENLSSYDDNHSDGENYDVSSDDNDESDDTEYDTEDEAFSEPIPANLTLVPGQQYRPGQPVRLDVNVEKEMNSYLPLCLLFNARSIFNKSDNLSELLQQIQSTNILHFIP